MKFKRSFPAIATRRSVAFVAVAASTLLPGCTTLGTNVKGSFRCEAPDGVCAPSTVIDDGALADIQRVSSSELLEPAGPYTIDDGEVSVPDAVLASADRVDRSAETYRLRVVFPAFVDARGQLHDRASVHTDVRLPGRGDTLDALAMRGSRRSSGRGLLSAAESAPLYLAVVAPATLIDQARPSDLAGAQLAVGPGPLDRIKEEVATALSADRPRREAASFPGTPE